MRMLSQEKYLIIAAMFLSLLHAAEASDAETRYQTQFSVHDVLRMVHEEIETSSYDMTVYDEVYTSVCFRPESRVWVVSYSGFPSKEVLQSIVFEMDDGVDEITVSHQERSLTPKEEDGGMQGDECGKEE